MGRLAIAVSVVLSFAAFGAVIAGDPSIGPYAALTKPPWSPPLWVWFLIGAAYYTGMVVVLQRLMARHTQPGARLALALCLLILLANELWNIFVFRFADPALAHFSLYPFAAIVVTAAAVAHRPDRPASALLWLYAGWLLFDLAWTGALLDMN